MSDRLAIVSGTSSGIGAAVCDRLLDRDWTVIGLARRAVERGDRYQHIAVDLARVDDATTAIGPSIVAAIDSRAWSRIALVNNAASGGSLGPFERSDVHDLQRTFALNVSMPMWLMALILGRGDRTAVRRIVNVSTGVAVRAFPGLAAYASSKAALRMAGMVIAAELDSAERASPRPDDVAILSYEPGAVDTEMQTQARSLPERDFPWVGLFRRFAETGILVAPNKPAAEIVDFLESARGPTFVERRLGA